jgi:UPF0716 protein FxsA
VEAPAVENLSPEGDNVRLLTLALVLPAATALVELVVLLAVGHLIGLGWALLILLGTSLLGAVLLRRVGGRAWRRFRATANSGRPPGREATDGALALTASLLITFPGFLTDALGALLFLPPVRAAAAALTQRALASRLSPDLVGQVFGPRKVRVRTGPATTFQPGTPLEGEIIEPGHRR